MANIDKHYLPLSPLYTIIHLCIVRNVFSVGYVLRVMLCRKSSWFSSSANVTSNKLSSSLGLLQHLLNHTVSRKIFLTTRCPTKKERNQQYFILNFDRSKCAIFVSRHHGYNAKLSASPGHCCYFCLARWNVFLLLCHIEMDCMQANSCVLEINWIWVYSFASNTKWQTANSRSLH